MIQVDVQQAQADLPRYLDDVAKGEIVVICRNQQPVAELRPISTIRTEPRPVGLGQGLIELRPNSFDPLPDELLAAFEGKSK